MAEKLRVLLVEPMEKPKVLEIEHTLENIQKLVGGLIQVIYPFDDEVCLVCDDEGKLEGKMLNRALVDKEGTPYDVVAGTFFLCGVSRDDFASLSEELAEKYAEIYRWPELFMKTMGGHVFWQKIGSKEPPRCIT